MDIEIVQKTLTKQFEDILREQLTNTYYKLPNQELYYRYTSTDPADPKEETLPKDLADQNVFYVSLMIQGTNTVHEHFNTRPTMRRNGLIVIGHHSPDYMGIGKIREVQKVFLDNFENTRHGQNFIILTGTSIELGREDNNPTFQVNLSIDFYYEERRAFRRLSP